MKICIYLEFYHLGGGFLFRKIGTGLLSSYKNQKTLLAQAGIPFIERWDDSCDILQINTPWLYSLHLAKKAHRQGKKVIIWSHVTVEDSRQVFRIMPLIAPIYKKYLVHAYKQADIIFAPSSYTKSLVAAYGIPADRIVVNSNGVDTKKYYRDERLRRSGREKYGQGDVRVGIVGLVLPRKGVDTFLNLAAQFPKTSFTWIGKMYSSIMVRPLPKVIPTNARFTGYVDNVNEGFNALDIFIFPSYEENEGMVILEAAAVGMPILVRDIPVYSDWLVDGENCLKAKTDAEFKTQLERLLNDPGLRKRLGDNALKLAWEKSVDTKAREIEKQYQQLMA